MKKIIGILGLFIANVLCAQHKTVSSDLFTIEGKVKTVVQFKLEEAASYKSVFYDSIVVNNHLGVRKSVLKKVKGILLKDVIAKASFDISDPKPLSEYFITCIATDGYKVVFSWNEVFNSTVGDKLIVITESDGKPSTGSTHRIAIISPADHATGRRYVHSVQKIVVDRVH